MSFTPVNASGSQFPGQSSSNKDEAASGILAPNSILGGGNVSNMNISTGSLTGNSGSLNLNSVQATGNQQQSQPLSTIDSANPSIFGNAAGGANLQSWVNPSFSFSSNQQRSSTPFGFAGAGQLCNPLSGQVQTSGISPFSQATQSSTPLGSTSLQPTLTPGLSTSSNLQQPKTQQPSLIQNTIPPNGQQISSAPGMMFGTGTNQAQTDSNQAQGLFRNPALSIPSSTPTTFGNTLSQSATSKPSLFGNLNTQTTSIPSTLSTTLITPASQATGIFKPPVSEPTKVFGTTSGPSAHIAVTTPSLGFSSLLQTPSSLKLSSNHSQLSQTATSAQPPASGIALGGSIAQIPLPSEHKVTFGGISEAGGSKTTTLGDTTKSSTDPQSFGSTLHINPPSTTAPPSTEIGSTQIANTSPLKIGSINSLSGAPPGILTTKVEPASIVSQPASLGSSASKPLSQPAGIDQSSKTSLLNINGKALNSPAQNLIAPSSVADQALKGTVPTPKSEEDICNSLKGKTLDEIVDRWNGQMEGYMKTFHSQATQVMNWDTSIFENSYMISKLCGKLKEVEDIQKEIDDTLNYIDTQQTCMEEMLETQQQKVVNTISNTDSSIRNRAFSDEERNRYLTLAQEIDSSLGDIYSQLSDLIEQLSSIQVGKVGTIGHLDSADILKNSEKGSTQLQDDSSKIKNAIVAILSDQLHTLDWLNSFSADVKQKIDVLSNEAYKASLKLHHAPKE